MNLLKASMAYPSRLLPQPHFKKIAWDETLRKCFLIHFTDSKDYIDPITQKLHIKMVVRRTDHLRDYSNNLLGVFIIDDIYWAVQESENKEYLIADWIEKSKVKTPIVPNEIEKNENRGYFFLPINNCHDKIVPYEDDDTIKPVCKLIHTPTNSNFWHFSLRWLCNGVDILDWTEKERRRILTAAKTFIIETASYNEPYFQELATIHYTD